jgi:Mg2+ and Co2+ transporter CorA
VCEDQKKLSNVAKVVKWAMSHGVNGSNMNNLNKILSIIAMVLLVMVVVTRRRDNI